MIVHTTKSSTSVAGPRDRLADARALYIVASGDTRVVLDGPALCVSREGRAAQLFPLRRLSRIYSSQRVDWTSEALLACAGTGIGVVFVDDDGEVTARLLGRPGERDELYCRLEEFLLLPQAEGMYRHWRFELRGRAAWWAGVKLAVPVAHRDPERCRDWVNRMAARYAGQREGERSRQRLQSLAFAWMQGHLQDLGLGLNTELGQAGEPPLARDLSDILMWYLEPARVGWLKRRYLAAQRRGEAVRPPRREDLVRLFECRATRAARRGREITSLLHRWLIHGG